MLTNAVDGDSLMAIGAHSAEESHIFGADISSN